MGTSIHLLVKFDSSHAFVDSCSMQKHVASRQFGNQPPGYCGETTASPIGVTCVSTVLLGTGVSAPVVGSTL